MSDVRNMEKKLSYYDYAEDDYNYLKDCIDAGIYRTSTASIAQETCVRYLKHVIITRFSLKANDMIMVTHSLRNLVRFIQDCTNDFEIDEKKLINIDEYYGHTRYPGNDSFFADKDDILEAFTVVKETKRAVDGYLHACTNEKGSLRELDLF